jgi:YesN/AraC family two-component response regulator
MDKMVDKKLLHTMDTGYTREDCRKTAEIVESYISLLLDAYGVGKLGQDSLVEKVKQYIFENYIFGFTASDIAKALGYNEQYLGRLFKERFGQNIKAYCNVLRINEAKRLLVSTDLSISEIAGLIGFNNTTYFNYVFANHTAMSPTQYRESALDYSG